MVKQAMHIPLRESVNVAVDSITLPEFWVWKPTESGPAEIARKVGNLPEFWVWKLPEIKASFFAAALKKQGIFSCYCKALSPICCSYKCCSACYIDSIQKLSLLQLLQKKIWPLPYTLPLLIPTCMQLHISVSHAAKEGKHNFGAKTVPISFQAKWHISGKFTILDSGKITTMDSGKVNFPDIAILHCNYSTYSKSYFY